MTILSKSVYVLAFIDSLIITLINATCLYALRVLLVPALIIALIFALLSLLFLSLKGFYSVKQYRFKDIFALTEGAVIASFIASLCIIPLLGGFALGLTLFNLLLILITVIITRTVYLLYKQLFKPVKNILIVGAGQDGKLIAEEIHSRPELGMKVVGFLDDNMNGIEEEDSSIPVLGLTYDSEAVIKDNNVDVVIIAVKSRMDSNILTDLAKGIPLGVKVWRMPTFYAHVTKKLFTSKMAVNWLFYDFVKTKHILYSYIKRLIDIVLSVLFLIITIPFSLIAILGIKISDFGPVFFTQTRIGKFGKPFKMVKFRTMYQDKVNTNFDDDLEDIKNNDNRIMPFCRWIRKFHIDDIPQLVNILKGEMSLVGPRPVREDVDLKNNENIRFWECRNWVRPGLTGWQQINAVDCIPEERLGYDLYYINHRTLFWEFKIYLQYLINVLTGRCK